MRKGIFLLVFLGLIGCSDGELQIETIDFDAVDLNFCGTATTQTELFFKLNEFDALILNLDNGLIRNQASTDTIRSAIPGGSQVRYRLFDDTVNSAYFCDVVPPVTPGVVEEIPGQSGEVLIFTTRSETDTTKFEHTIRLKNVSFVNDAGERLTNIAVDDFGAFTTAQN
ncbi:MAG: hypothetical protein WBM56_10020 [Robiginitalea sp.]|uniref:hypothetical protein n=1 Tax=Robiginitalea sp. TaxID=1902411 RepID=UPI003C717EDB